MAKQKINIVTLGCSKNTVDSEYLIAQLTGNGFEVVHDSNDESAKTVVINTCGFIGDAKEESVNTILNFARAKQAGIINNLFVFGCLAERYINDLKAEIPEVTQFFGVNNLADIVRAVGGAYKEELIGSRAITTPKHYAYLKISEGCNWGCSYCAIPLIRGKHVSVPVEMLVKQTKNLATEGVKELLVIAQDTTYYGLDLYGKRQIAYLLDKLSEVEGIERIRLHYAYPANFPADLLKVMGNNPKICKYLDIPFQHISNKVLSNMRRGITSDETYRLIADLRNAVPDIALRTTLITGHPGEGKPEFQELMDFVNNVRFDLLGVFPYSEEEGTYAAINLKDTISQKEKASRAYQIMSIQNKISAEITQSKIGKTFKVLIDSEDPDFFVGRTEFDSPEIDREVLITKADNLKPGMFVNVNITEAEDYDLYGTIVN